MRTTLKRGIGRSSAERAGVRRVDPPVAPPRVRRYQQPRPSRPSTLRRAIRVVGWLAVGVLVVGSGLAGGSYLWLHQSVAALRAHSRGVVLAERKLAAELPGQPATALLLGDNQRAGFEASAGGRSDTIMLIRADPQTKTISMLSLPRDLRVPVYCPSSPVARDVTRIDYAFAWCGPEGSLETVQKLTGLRINYLITVDFHGFKEIVNDLGGIWLDVDRRYLNRNVGTAATDFSNIDLQPGYQLLSGGSALEFVRFRHTDSDFYRQARQQEFLRALKEQLARNLDPLRLPKIVAAVVHNVEIGACSTCLSDSTILRYALFALTLPRGHLLQNYVPDTTNVVIGGADELQAPPTAVAQTVYGFTHPRVPETRAATPARRPTPHVAPAPAPQRTTVTVLNGNGVPGAAANMSGLLAGRGYVTMEPPLGQAPNAPTENYPQSEIYFDPARAGAQAAAGTLRRLLAPAGVQPLPDTSSLRALDPGSMLVVIVGHSSNGSLTGVGARVTASAGAASVAAAVRVDRQTGRALLGPLASRAGFRLETPTVLDASSEPDTLSGDVAARLYWIAPHHRAVRLVFRTGGGEYWGIEETGWAGAPVLETDRQTQTLDGRTFELHYAGAHLHMVVLHEHGASYWLINTLLDSLPNRTMLAIARGLQALPAHG